LLCVGSGATFISAAHPVGHTVSPPLIPPHTHFLAVLGLELGASHLPPTPMPFFALVIFSDRVSCFCLGLVLH
jgi:hypothetical protein